LFKGKSSPALDSGKLRGRQVGQAAQEPDSVLPTAGGTAFNVPICRPKGSRRRFRDVSGIVERA
jgi:hypothetical protein